LSLVIEALRRVEKTDARTGSIGAAVASYRPVPKPRSSMVPLLLGLLTGGSLVLLMGARSGGGVGVSTPSAGEPSGPPAAARPLKGAAGLPPPLIIEPAVRSAEARTSPRAAEPLETAPVSETPPLVLQAISERDSRPIAIINDQLVNEGDKVGPVRVLRIGADLVEVQLPNGKSDIVRFAPPPPPLPEASPSPDPHR